MDMNKERMTIVPKEKWLEMSEKAKDCDALVIINAGLQGEVNGQRKVILFYRVLVISLIVGFAIIHLKI